MAEDPADDSERAPGESASTTAADTSRDMSNHSDTDRDQPDTEPSEAEPASTVETVSDDATETAEGDVTGTAEGDATAETTADTADESTGVSAGIERYVRYVLLAGFTLLALIALLRFYLAASNAISVWVASEYQSLFQALFNLIILLLAGIGISWQVRRLR